MTLTTSTATLELNWPVTSVNVKSGPRPDWSAYHPKLPSERLIGSGGLFICTPAPRPPVGGAQRARPPAPGAHAPPRRFKRGPASPVTPAAALRRLAALAR